MTLLQLCEGVQDKVAKVGEKKINSRYCEECNVERIMYPSANNIVSPDIFLSLNRLYF